VGIEAIRNHAEVGREIPEDHYGVLSFIFANDEEALRIAALLFADDRTSRHLITLPWVHLTRFGEIQEYIRVPALLSLSRVPTAPARKCKESGREFCQGSNSRAAGRCSAQGGARRKTANGWPQGGLCWWPGGVSSVQHAVWERFQACKRRYAERIAIRVIERVTVSSCPLELPGRWSGAFASATCLHLRHGRSRQRR
jgi:hypothetical protein